MSSDDESDGVPIIHLHAPTPPKPLTPPPILTGDTIVNEDPISKAASPVRSRRKTKRKIVAPKPQSAATKIPTPDELEEKHKRDQLKEREQLEREYHLSLQRLALKQSQSLSGIRQQAQQQQQQTIEDPDADYLPPEMDPSQLQYEDDPEVSSGDETLSVPRSRVGNIKHVVRSVLDMPTPYAIIGVLTCLVALPMHGSIEKYIGYIVFLLFLLFKTLLVIILLVAVAVLIYKFMEFRRTQENAKKTKIPPVAAPAAIPDMAPTPLAIEPAPPPSPPQEHVVPPQPPREPTPPPPPPQQQPMVPPEKPKIAVPPLMTGPFPPYWANGPPTFMTSYPMQAYPPRSSYGSTPQGYSPFRYVPAQTPMEIPGYMYTPAAQYNPLYNKSKSRMRFPSATYKGVVTPDERLEFPAVISHSVTVKPPTPPPEKLVAPALERNDSFGTPAVAVFHAREEAQNMPRNDDDDMTNFETELKADMAYKPYGPAPRRYEGLTSP